MAPPEDFRTALLSLRSAVHPHVEIEEVPAPRALAPFTAALALRTTQTAHDEALAFGRFVILHDPNGQMGWNGPFRLVAQLRAQIDADMSSDPFFLKHCGTGLTTVLKSAVPVSMTLPAL